VAAHTVLFELVEAGEFAVLLLADFLESVIEMDLVVFQVLSTLCAFFNFYPLLISIFLRVYNLDIV
jgi:hypothetical protein